MSPPPPAAITAGWILSGNGSYGSPKDWNNVRKEITFLSGLEKKLWTKRKKMEILRKSPKKFSRPHNFVVSHGIFLSHGFPESPKDGTHAHTKILFVGGQEKKLWWKIEIVQIFSKISGTQMSPPPAATTAGPMFFSDGSFEST